MRGEDKWRAQSISQMTHQNRWEAENNGRQTTEEFNLEMICTSQERTQSNAHSTDLKNQQKNENKNGYTPNWKGDKYAQSDRKAMKS